VNHFRILRLLIVRQVYSHTDWNSMGFLVIQPEYRVYAVKLGIKEHPTAGQLVRLLETNPPGTPEAANWFRLLASRVNGMS
jgi:hypothetical protein